MNIIRIKGVEIDLTEIEVALKSANLELIVSFDGRRVGLTTEVLPIKRWDIKKNREVDEEEEFFKDK